MYHQATRHHRLNHTHDDSFAVLVATIWYLVHAVKLHGRFTRNSAFVDSALYVARGIVVVARIVLVGSPALSVRISIFKFHVGVQLFALL